ncbi:MAG: rubrerythrin family protein [Planctomycetes bacterium]|nr:rubrerythrin family protein [Planctomycetota bacterium]
MDAAMTERLVEAQRNEITEHHVYLRLAAREKNPANRDVLERIAADERKHYEFWGERTGQAPPPRRGKLLKYTWLARLLGLTFAIKLMERGEEGAQVNYAEVAEHVSEARGIIEDEEKHEKALVAMLDEERLRYVGSVVLGLSDALVELTGALAGLTLALQNNRLIALIGLVTGVAASLSMAASEYLSTKSEAADAASGDDAVKSPIKAATYTGIAYVFAVAALVAPFLLLETPVLALGVSLAAAMAIVFVFTYYISVARDLPLGRRFGEMAGLVLGVSALSFGIGFLLRLALGVEV